MELMSFKLLSLKTIQVTRWLISFFLNNSFEDILTATLQPEKISSKY